MGLSDGVLRTGGRAGWPLLLYCTALATLVVVVATMAGACGDPVIAKLLDNIWNRLSQP